MDFEMKNEMNPMKTVLFPVITQIKLNLLYLGITETSCE